MQTFQHTKHLTISYLLDGPTDTRTHTRTHAHKKWWLRPLITSSSSEDRWAETQSLSRTSPPRVVFELSGPRLQRERAGSKRREPRSFSSSRESSRASQHVLVRRGADPSRGCVASPRNHLQEEAESHQAGNKNGEQKAPRTKKKRKKPPLAARAEQKPKLTEPAEAKSFRRPQP